MVIYPAVDIRGGKCVRLYQGEFDKEKVYSGKPYEMARKWENQGAEFLHLVDLDGALSGSPQNIEAVRKIAESVKIPSELGGGIRTFESLTEVLSLGIERAILGTVIVKDLDFVKRACHEFGDRVVAGIDVRHGQVSVDGWSQTTELNAIDVAKELQSLGIRRIIYTDILSDGALRGINFQAFKNLAESLDIPITASGGVTTLEDIVRLKELESLGVDGVIIGKALYEGRISLREAIEVARS